MTLLFTAILAAGGQASASLGVSATVVKPLGARWFDCDATGTCEVLLGDVVTTTTSSAAVLWW